MIRLIIFLLLSVMLVGCGIQQNNNKSASPSEVLMIRDYFPLENKTFFYKGEGNEFASYKEDFFQKTDEYLPSIVENGGTRIFKVYQLTDEGIYLVYEQPEYYEESPLEVETVKSQFKKVPLLMAPLNKGIQFNNSTITKLDEELTLPIGHITNVIVTEERDEENQTVQKKYWAPNYGLVKTEFISSEDETFIVTSELESIQ